MDFSFLSVYKVRILVAQNTSENSWISLVAHIYLCNGVANPFCCFALLSVRLFISPLIHKQSRARVLIHGCAPPSRIHFTIHSCAFYGCTSPIIMFHHPHVRVFLRMYASLSLFVCLFIPEQARQVEDFRCRSCWSETADLAHSTKVGRIHARPPAAGRSHRPVSGSGSL